MRNIKKAVLVLASFLTAALLFPPTGTRADVITEGGAGYKAVLYDKGNGLPTSDANAIVQTDDGFIWIGGYAGLIRYDGTDFYRFDSSSGVASVVSLFVDEKNRVWIGTNDNGVACYEKGEITFFDDESTLKSSSIRSIEEDLDGNIIIATTSGIAYVDSENTLHALDDPQLNGEYVCELRGDQRGVIYGETLDGEFFSIENKRVTKFINGESLGVGLVNSICPDPLHEGYVYIGNSESGVAYGSMDAGFTDFREISVAPLINVNTIYPSGEQVWICADNGIGFFDSERHFHLLDNLPMTNSVDDMIEDYEGNLWFVSSRQGVMKITDNQFIDISQEASLPSLVVNSTCKYRDELYLGTDSGLYILGGDGKMVENDLTRELSGIRIRSIKKDSRENLWLCTYSDKGLLCVHKNGKEDYYNEKNGMNSNRVRTTMELPDGRIAVATSGGLHILENGKITEIYDESDGVSNTEILTVGVTMDENQNLLLGSDGDGIYMVEGNSVTRIGKEDGLPSGVILRIREDPQRNLNWIITSNSICYMKDREITKIRNFPYSNNFDLYYDDNGGIWILSSNGIYVVQAEELLKDSENMEYTFYDTDNGLPTITTANSRSFLDDDGRLYISGNTGVCSVNVNETYSDLHEIKLAIPFVEADDVLYPVENNRVTIPAGAKRVTIDAYVLTFSLNNPQISYELRGFDDSPFETTKKDMTPAVYTNLDGGIYTFHFAVTNTLTGEESEFCDITIVKTEAFYESIWFTVILVTAAAGLVILFVALYYRRRMRKFEKKQEEDRKMIGQLSKTFAKCIDIKDTYTNGHSFRVAKYTRWIAEKMGYPEAKVEEYYNIALLHDIGKIGIPDKILNKPEALDEEEYQVMKSHAEKGYEILSDFREIDPELAYGAGYHHERFDGKGYPRGVSGEEIPEVSRIIAVADTFDAMYSTRPYRKKLPLETVVGEIEKCAGTQLDPKIVEIFMELYREHVFDNE